MTLHRLVLDGVWPDAAKDIFADLTRHNSNAARLRLCLHTAGLRALDSDERFIVSELTAPYRREALEVFQTARHGEPTWADIPEVIVSEVDTFGDDRATVRLRLNQNTASSASVWQVRQAQSVFESLVPNIPAIDIIPLTAAEDLGAHLTVTADASILRFRDRLNLTNVLTPREAFPIVGVWSRAIGQSYLAGPIGMADWYSWVLTRALTPAAWPGHGAFLAGRRLWPNGMDLFELAGSALSRLDRLIRDLDAMAIKWQSKGQERIAEDLAVMLLEAAAVSDNLALLSGKYLGAKLKGQLGWSFARKEWKKALQKTGDQRALALLAHLTSMQALLDIPLLLRHRVAHRSPLSRVRTDSGRSERVELSGELWLEIKSRLERAGDSPQSWGITGVRGPEVIRVVEHARDGSKQEYDEPSMGSASLDSMAFAARLVAETAKLVNSVFEILNPGADPRLPESERAALGRPPKNDRLFSVADSRAAILSSPLSGLVDYAPKSLDSQVG